MEELEIYPKKFASFKKAILKKILKQLLLLCPLKKKL